MKISFDYDGTLRYKEVYDMAEELIREGHDVCILTTRYSDVSRYLPEGASNDDLYDTAKRLGIKVIHTEYEFKVGHIDKYEIDIHIDDNYRDEVVVINRECKAKAILFTPYSSEWKKELRKLIDENNN